MAGSGGACQAEKVILLQILLQGVSCVPDSLEPCQKPPLPLAQHGQPKTVAGSQRCAYRSRRIWDLVVAGLFPRCVGVFC